MKINSTPVQWIRLKKIIQASLLLCGVFPFLAHGYVLSDLGGDATAYWGGNAHGYGDVIGDSTYNVNGAEVSLSNGILSVRILTNFAGHAGQDGWAGPNGIGYGDVFLAQSWNPFGSDAHHVNDDASNGTLWTYGFSLDDRWSNTGGTFRVYALNGAKNADNVLLSNDFLTCGIASQCYYRDGQATAVDTTSASVVETGLTGNWTVTPDSMLEFTLSTSGTAFASYTEMALHWGETCQNDVIEGFGTITRPGDPETAEVPEPSTFALLGFGLVGFAAARRRRNNAAAACKA